MSHHQVFPGVCLFGGQRFRLKRSIQTQGAVTCPCLCNTESIRGCLLHTHTHACTQRLSADCNEMSNHLCQMACLPAEEKRRACAKNAHLPPLLLLLLLLLFLLLHHLSGSLDHGEKLKKQNAVSPCGAAERLTPLLSSPLLLEVTSEQHMADRLLIWIQKGQMRRAGELAWRAVE